MHNKSYLTGKLHKQLFLLLRNNSGQFTEISSGLCEYHIENISLTLLLKS